MAAYIVGSSLANAVFPVVMLQRRPVQFNEVQFTMKLWEKKHNVARRLNLFLDKRFLGKKIGLGGKQKSYSVLCHVQTIFDLGRQQTKLVMKQCHQENQLLGVHNHPHFDIRKNLLAKLRVERSDECLVNPRKLRDRLTNGSLVDTDWCQIRKMS